MAISTAGGLTPRGYFMPYRYAADAGRRVADGYPSLTPFFDKAAGDFEAMLDALDSYGETLLGFDGPPPEPRWRQDWFPGLDGAVMYATVLDQRPARIVEVGSGHSTRFMARAIRDGGFNCHLTAIDPAPRADIAALDIELVREPLQRAPLDSFDRIKASDIVSMDSSHLAVAGSDVDIFINTILPRLPSGVLVHIHDMFLPDPYPAAWTWREYNEQSLVAPLIHTGGYQLKWSSRWARKRMAEKIGQTRVGNLHLPDGAIESSLWLEKN